MLANAAEKKKSSERKGGGGGKLDPSFSEREGKRVLFDLKRQGPDLRKWRQGAERSKGKEKGKGT